MAVTCLPTIPFVILGIVEPVLLVWAYITTLLDPFTFYVKQAQNYELPLDDPSSFPPQAQIMTLQLVNVYLLLAAMALICTWTTHAGITRLYLAAVALADYGHIWACYVGVGYELFVRPAEWNDLLWGSVGVSVFLNAVRLLTLAGVFGAVKDHEGSAKKKAA
ncbi:hypothetical protein F5B22DRAFT_165914 [Xylaria bambusicola]|uniref:uncharacterized protein n=1 Tax=Xylaria bambusicola TaxID=326684 RepID=UPI0020086643|nr:uncharacterized protein F5B22DRAFT_165914 [Xylaria bambusicola]KAI0526568.1 hypothetical protein F5B22DRAFT_165914 [Xylaria bambusicola]